MKKNETSDANYQGPGEDGVEAKKDYSGRESFLPPRGSQQDKNSRTPELNGKSERVQNSNAGNQDHNQPKSDHNKGIPLPNSNEGSESGRELDDTDHDHDYKNPTAAEENTQESQQGSDTDSETESRPNDISETKQNNINL